MSQMEHNTSHKVDKTGIFAKLKAFLTRIWHKISSLGIKEHDSILKQKNITLTNRLAFSLLNITIPYIFIFSFLGEPIIGVSLIFVVAAHSSVLILNSFRLTVLARYLMILTVTSAITIYASLLGEASGVHIYYIAVFCFPFLVFQLSEWKNILIGLALPFLLYTSVYIFSFSSAPGILLSPEVLRFIAISMEVTTIITIVMAIWYLSHMNSVTETQLLDARQKAEEANIPLKKAEEEARKFKLLVEASGQGIGIATMEKSIVYANPELLSFFKTAKLETIQGKEFGDMYTSASKEKIENEVVPALMEKGEWKGDLVLQSQDGSLRDTIENMFIIRDEEGNPEFIADIMTDITDRKKAEAELKEAKERTEFAQFAVDQAVDMAFWVTLEDGRLFYVNTTGAKRIGYTKEELIGMKISDIDPGFPEEKWPEFATRLAIGEPLLFESIHRTKSGSEYPVEITAQYVEFGGEKKVIAFARDISERKKAEAKLNTAHEKVQNMLFDLKNAQSQLVQSEKMASLGQLTAGVAHELNNPINFVGAGTVALSKDISDLMNILDQYEELEKGKGNLEVHKKIINLKEELDYDYLKKNVQQTLDDMKLGASRTADIVRGLRNFTRLDPEKEIMADLHDGLDGTLTVLQNKLKHKVEVVRKYAKDIELISCYPGQLNQVFLNMIANAEEAIEKEGTITITTKAIKDSVSIEIEDDGVGMSDEVKAHIFDPFYTTKEVGDGVGLGMSISYGIIQKHKGTITVESVQGKGTKFTVMIPR